jgi:hypothetical protein
MYLTRRIEPQLMRYMKMEKENGEWRKPALLTGKNPWSIEFF